MKITYVTEYDGSVRIYDMDSYDGAPDAGIQFIGTGDCVEDAVEDLIAQLMDRIDELEETVKKLKH